MITYLKFNKNENPEVYLRENLNEPIQLEKIENNFNFEDYYYIVDQNENRIGTLELLEEGYHYWAI